MLENKGWISECQVKTNKGVSMSIVKVIEVISEGSTIDEALQSAVTEASKTLKDIKQINVNHIEGIVEGKKIKKIRINSKISFVLER